MSPVRLACLVLSMTAHAALLASLGGMAAGAGGEGTPSQRPAVLRATLIAESVPASAPPPSPPAGLADASPALAEAEAVAAALPAGEPLEPSASQAGPRDGGAAVLPVLPVTEPYYFPLADLTQPPQVQRDIPPGKALLVPESVPRTVRMSLFINEQGSVDRIEFDHDAALPSAIVQALDDTFSALRFQPGRQGEQAVKSRMNIEVSLDDILHIGRGVPSSVAN